MPHEGNLLSGLPGRCDDSGILLKVELPEVADKDVDIRVEGNTPTLTGERKIEAEEKDEKGRGYTRVERWHGSFMRSFTLPSTVDVEHVSARTTSLRSVRTSARQRAPRGRVPAE